MSRALCSFAALLILCMLVPAQAGEAPSSQPAAQPVDFRKLKECLPQQLAGIKRTEIQGQKMKMGEFTISMAEATYRDDSDGANVQGIEVHVMDYGATQGMADAMTAWRNLEIDREGDDGYERTTKIGEHPAMESYETKPKTGQLQVFVAARFIVSVNTKGLPAEQLARIGAELPLAALAELK